MSTEGRTTALLGLGPAGVVTVEPTQTVVEWGRVRFAELPAFYRAARKRVDAALAAQGTTRTGAELSFSRRAGNGEIDIAPGFVITGSFTPTGSVAVQPIPAGRAAHIRLDGPYENLPRAWGELMAWVEAEALVPAGLQWEVYGNGPEPAVDLFTLLS